MANDVIPEGSAAAEVDDKDMATLLERIRARYKLTCSVLGVRPRGANGESPPVDQDEAADFGNTGKGMAIVHGRAVDTTKLNF